MLLSCGVHQLCPACASELIREKLWCAGGPEIDNRVECYECKATAVIDRISLTDCRCSFDAKNARATRKFAFDFGKKSTLRVRIKR